MENLQEMKKKFESGEYVLIGYFLDRGFNYWAETDKLIKDNCLVKEYKLIHKKHKHILDAYLEDNSVQIIRIDYANNIIGMCEIRNFIEQYDENKEYQLKQLIPKNNFKDFGFSGDFEGEIKFKDEFECFVGIVEHHKHIPSKTNKPQTCYWNEKGECFIILKDEIYRCYGRDLTPLKKEWYEYVNDKNIKFGYRTDIGGGFPVLIRGYNRKTGKLEINGNLEEIDVDLIRPATKEEVEKLIIKE